MAKDYSPSLEEIRKLREKTKAGVLDCRRALDEVGGDLAKAEEWLAKKGMASAEKRSERLVNSGLVETYVHAQGRVGAMIELACETDFVAKNEEFTKLAHELCLQLAALPAVSVEEFLKQDYIREAGKKIAGLLKEMIGKLGENIVLKRIARFELGQAE